VRNLRVSTLAQLDPLVTWNAALMHVGLEGLNANRGELSAQSALGSLDFGDGSAIVETTEPRVRHEYNKGSRGTYIAYVEAVNALTRSNVASATVRIIRR
jgi:hypothetical protein